MSEIYFLFYEELDWSAQLRKAGYRLWYEPAAVVYHKESMTAKRGSPMREFYLSRAVCSSPPNLQGFRNTCLVPTSASSPLLKSGRISAARTRRTCQGNAMRHLSGNVRSVPIKFIPIKLIVY